ncbi:hypothetical protein [Paraburkholderia sp.]|jgi:hypothetical protein|uniref:hypothetical protein n=1 Tax=Paraburkholderia sp. TaxID=1926495 RepID=UPI002F412717
METPVEPGNLADHTLIMGPLGARASRLAARALVACLADELKGISVYWLAIIELL